MGPHTRVSDAGLGAGADSGPQAGAGVRKPPREETAGRRGAGGDGAGLWGRRSADRQIVDESANGEDLPARPGSWSRAKAWDGSPGNLRDPVRVHGRNRPDQGTPADQLFQAWRASSAPVRSASASTKQRRSAWDL